MERSDLHPWPVLRGLVLELSSYEVPKVIDSTGLRVDWSLSKEKDYSDKMRISAYRPRIDAAYAELNDEGSLRAAFVVAEELARRGHAERLDLALRAIGWMLKDGKLSPASEPIRELFFPKQSQHNAYTEIRTILQTATQSIEIIDPYIDQSVLTLVGTAVRPSMSVRVLTARAPPDLAVEITKWRAQYAGTSIEVRTTREFHDRFLVIDGTACWHVGCSLKDAGTKVFMLSRVEDAANRDALLSQITSSWAAGIEVK